MSAPPVFSEVHEQAGVVVASTPTVVVLLDRKVTGLSIVAFVLGIGAILLLGLVGILISTGIGDVAALLPLCVVVAMDIGLTAFFVKRIRQQRALPPEQLPVIASFDVGRDLFVDRHGQPVCPLHQVKIIRRLQATSSSPKLVAVTPTGSVTLVSGSPFSGGLGNLGEVITWAITARGGRTAT